MKTILFVLLGLIAFATAQDCQNTAIVFNVDGSSSISDGDFEIVKQFMIEFSELYDWGESQAGIVQFSSDVRIESPMTFSQSSFDTAVNNIQQMKASTKTGAGISQSTDLLLPVDEGDFTRIILTLTDGQAKDDVSGPVDEALDEGIILFGIGFGTDVTRAGLETIASEPFDDYVYLFTDFGDSLEAVDTIFAVVCTGAPPPAECNDKLATVFNVDGSSSISDSDFNIVQQFILEFSDLYNFPVSQMGMVQFASDVVVEQEMTFDKDEFDAAASSLVQMKASTKTGAGITQSTALLEPVSDSFTKILITLTDGQAKDETAGPVDEAESQGIILFGIGFGEAVTQEGLESISSEPFDTHTYLFTDFVDSLDAVSRILDAACGVVTGEPTVEPPTIEPPTIETPSIPSIETPSIPSIETPSVPSIETPSIPSPDESPSNSAATIGASVVVILAAIALFF